jgi:hypothetical protein
MTGKSGSEEKKLNLNVLNSALRGAEAGRSQTLATGLLKIFPFRYAAKCSLY